IPLRRVSSRRWKTTALLACLALTAACTTFTDAPTAPKESLALAVTFDKPSYRPGEAVVARVRLTNNTARAQTAARLDAHSVSFWFGRADDEERMRRDPVVSSQEKLDQTVTLAPGQSLDRPFLLTGFTQFAGAPGVGGFLAQAQYEPRGASLDLAAPRLFSNVVPFRVEGARLFERDPAGLISEADAIRLAREAFGPAGAGSSGANAADAVLVLDEKGFAKWWVNVTTAAPGRAAARQGAFVDPYRGIVWAKAQPFDLAMKRDPRRIDPATLPPPA
ncbi:MAG: hypothetical protein M1457_06065, partial [bacterium]|nr:hypothetical protein [bacterium]